MGRAVRPLSSICALIGRLASASQIRPLVKQGLWISITIPPLPVSRQANVAKDTLLGQGEFIDFPVDRSRRNAKHLGGFYFITVSLPERVFNQPFFRLFNVADRLRADFLAMSRRVVLQVHG